MDCVICCEPREHFVEPCAQCGYIMYSGCYQQLRRNRCPFCRTRYTGEQDPEENEVQFLGEENEVQFLGEEELKQYTPSPPPPRLL